MPPISTLYPSTSPLWGRAMSMPERKTRQYAHSPHIEDPCEAESVPLEAEPDGFGPELREQHLRLLVRAGQTLGSSLYFHETLQHAASLMVPHVADLCIVDVVDENRRGVQLIGVAHADPRKAEWAQQLREQYPVALHAPDTLDGVGSVIRTGQATLIPIVTQSRLEAYARDEEHLRFLERIGPRSVIITPLVARGFTIGALLLVWTDTDRHYDETDLQFAQEFACRAALAVDNARLFQQTQELNATLERRVSEKTRQVWQLASEVASAETRERGRIARLLHDDLQQQLHAALFQLAELRGHALNSRLEEFGECYTEAVERLKAVLRETRALTGELSPMVLHTEDFTSALRWLAERFREQHNLSVGVEAPTGLQFPNEALRDLLFSLVKECLFNVVKHAGVNEAQITLRQSKKWVEVEIRDEGAGFDPSLLKQSVDNVTGFGLRSAAQRVQLFDGEFRIESQGNQRGTRITVALPSAALFTSGRPMK